LGWAPPLAEGAKALGSAGRNGRATSQPPLIPPIAVAAADESRDELQDLWARLLAAATDPKRAKTFRIAFVDLAKKMDPLDTVVFQQASVSNQVITGTTRNELATKLNLSRDQLDVSLSHLIELNLM
jgi:Abortive infection alpha